MSFIDDLGVSDSDKRKIEDMHANSAADLVGMIRASESAARNHLGSSLVDKILTQYKSLDNGTVEPGKFGAFF